MSDLQRIAVKIHAEGAAGMSLDPLLVVFGRWRGEPEHPEQWVDLADYAHIPRGPGIVLVGKRANFSFEQGGSGPGFLYASKTDLSGDDEQRLRAVLGRCFQLAARLAGEPEFPGRVRPCPESLDLIFNDRLATPNLIETDRRLRPSVTAALDRLYGSGAWQMAAETDPGQRFGFAIRSRHPLALETLAARAAA